MSGMRYIEGEPFDFAAVRIEEILPQRPPVLVVSSLLGHCADETVTSFTVGEDNVFLDPVRGFCAEGLMENAAQTCSARIGFISKYVENRPVSIGLLCRIRNFTVHCLPSVGDALHTSVSATASVGQMTIFKTRTFRGPELIAEGELAVAESDQDSEESAI